MHSPWRFPFSKLQSTRAKSTQACIRAMLRTALRAKLSLLVAILRLYVNVSASSSWSRSAVDPRTPRHLPAFDHLLKHLSVSECVHCAPEPFIPIGDELACLDQAVERL